MLDSERHSPKEDRFFGNREPRLAELINDPMTHQIMARDKLDMESLLAEVERAQEALRKGAA